MKVAISLNLNFYQAVASSVPRALAGVVRTHSAGGRIIAAAESRPSGTSCDQ